VRGVPAAIRPIREDFAETRAPSNRPKWRKRPHGMKALGGDDPFLMTADGKCQIFVPSGLEDGPLHGHYEPPEKPVRSPVYDQQHNPTAKLWHQPGNRLNPPEDPRFPYVLTTYRLTKLHCGEVIGRVTPHRAEAFVELPTELAVRLGIANLDWTVLSTLRGEVEVRALVTERLRPFVIGDKTIYPVGLPWVDGWEGYARGDVANVLLAITGDANTSIHSTEALTCNLRRGRLGMRKDLDPGW